MKKGEIFLSAVFLACIAACTSHTSDHDKEWMAGDKKSKDTAIRGQQYRYYNNRWFPVYNNMIAPLRYNGASLRELNSPVYRPAMSVYGAEGMRTGGFGESSHGSAGE